MSETYVAVWGMSSLVIGFGAVGLFVIAMIWNWGMVGQVMASVVVISLFSLIAALFVQSAIDRQSEDATTQSTDTNHRG